MKRKLTPTRSSRVISICALLLTAFMVLSACSGPVGGTTASTPGATDNPTNGTSSEQPGDTIPADVDGAYPETVTVQIGRENMASLDLPDGDNIEKNKYLDYIKEVTNIDVQYAWIADTSSYDEKVNLAISSGDIPDIMYVNSAAQVKQLVENDLVEDLTGVMEQYGSETLNEYYELYGPTGLESSMFDNKMMALPNLNGGYEFSFMWVRNDWVKAVGAELPTDLDGIANLAKTFMEKDPNGNGAGKTIGIAVNNKVCGIYNNLGNIDPIFGAFKSFPRQWVRQSDGTIAYGSVSAETKTALTYVAGLYDQGIIDPEFAVRTSDEFNSLLLSGQCGIFFGPWWMPDWPLNSALANNPKADWVPVLAPIDDTGSFNVYRQRPNNQWMVVRKGYEHPEILFKLTSFAIEHQNDPDVQNFYPDSSVLWNIWPGLFILRYEDTIPRMYNALSDAIERRDPSKLEKENVSVYESCIAYLDTGDPQYWQMYTCRYIGPEVTTRDEVVAVDNIYPIFSDTMELKWANLSKMEDEMILKIIMGEQSIDTFDQFVTNWMSTGGEEITAEVNEAFGG